MQRRAGVRARGTPSYNGLLGPVFWKIFSTLIKWSSHWIVNLSCWSDNWAIGPTIKHANQIIKPWELIQLINRTIERLDLQLDLLIKWLSHWSLIYHVDRTIELLNLRSDMLIMWSSCLIINPTCWLCDRVIGSSIWHVDQVIEPLDRLSWSIDLINLSCRAYIVKP